MNLRNKTKKQTDSCKYNAQTRAENADNSLSLDITKKTSFLIIGNLSKDDCSRKTISNQ